MLQEEVDRRKFMEAKVQTYVRSLIEQNGKCKAFIQEQVIITKSTNDPELAEKAREFMLQLERSQFDEHDGQSTENDDDDGEDEEEEDVQEEALTEGEADATGARNEDVAISDI